jgi:hypothetical protein
MKIHCQEMEAGPQNDAELVAETLKGNTMPSARAFNRRPKLAVKNHWGVLSFLRQNVLPVPLNPVDGNSKHWTRTGIFSGSQLVETIFLCPVLKK